MGLISYPKTQSKQLFFLLSHPSELPLLFCSVRFYFSVPISEIPLEKGELFWL